MRSGPVGMSCTTITTSRPRRSRGPSSRRFRARPNELLERFRDLRILSYEEGIVADPDGNRMALARLVACKGSPGY